jgi:uncharacterized iron-regulated protein
MQLRPPAGFSQPLGHAHGLVGRIYATAQRRFVSTSTLEGALADAALVVLGETHDNRDHHLLEAQLLRAFGAAHGQVRVGFEMLDAKQGVELARGRPQSADALAERVAWANSGWPDFALYRPVFEAALSLGATLVAAHPDAPSVHASLAGVSASTAHALGLDVPLPEAQLTAQREEIRESHCGQAPAAMVVAMQRAQSFKDAFMARALIQSGPPALLVAGRGHARNDRGVPLFWQRAGQHSTLSVAFVDVSDAALQPSQYDLAAFDFVVFTPRVSDEDACERFRRELEKMRRHSPSAPTAAR